MKTTILMLSAATALMASSTAATIKIDFGNSTSAIESGYDRGDVSSGGLVINDVLNYSYDTNNDSVGDFTVGLFSNQTITAGNRAGSQYSQDPENLFYDYALVSGNGGYITIAFSSTTGGTLDFFKGYVDKAGETYDVPQTVQFGELGGALTMIDNSVIIQDDNDSVTGDNTFSSSDSYTIDPNILYEIRLTENSARNFAFLSGIELEFTPTAAVPEPSSTALIGLAALGFALRRRR